MNFYRLNKCQEYLEEEMQLIKTFYNDVNQNWSGSDKEELCQKIIELIKQINIVIKNIDFIRIQIQEAIEEEKEEQEGEE